MPRPKLARTRSRRRIANVRWAAAFLFTAAGAGLLVHGGLRWRELPSYSERDIEQSAALNLALDEQRRGGPTVITSDQRAQRLEREKQEVRTDIHQERAWIRTEMTVGLALLLVAAGQAAAAWLSQRAAFRT